MDSCITGGRGHSEDQAFRYHRDMLIVTGSVEARPDTMIASWSSDRRTFSAPAWSRGCILHSIHRDVENELRVVFIEQWEDTQGA